MVSVIIPCYNYGKYLDFSVNSILEQTYQDVEIIIVNDGSDDAYTVQKLNTYNKPRTKIIHREKGYPAAARNTGFKHASGDYILVLDSDDLLEKTFIEKALMYLQADARTGVVSSYVLDFGYVDCIWRPTGGGIENFKYKINCGSAALLRRAAWEECGGYNEKFIHIYEDWNFWIDITKRGWSIKIIPELLFYYRTKEVSRVTDVNTMHHMVYQHIMETHPDVYGAVNEVAALSSI